MEDHIIGNKQHEEQFTKLVMQNGQRKWAEIARQLKIYGIIVQKPNKLYSIWDRLNPQNRDLNINEIQDLVKFGIEAKGDCRKYIKMMIEKNGRGYTQIRKLGNVYHHNVTKLLKKLITILPRKKLQSNKRLSGLRMQAISRIFQLEDTKRIELQQLSKIAGIMIQLFQVCNIHQFESRTQQYSLYSKIISRGQFELGLEYIIQIDILIRIHDKSLIDDKQLENKCYLLEPTIQQNKESPLYKELFQEISYVDFYNDAKNANFDQQFVYNPIQQPKKHKQVAQTLNAVQGKKNKTVRGRIRLENAKVYHSEYSSRFINDLQHHEEDDIESDIEILNQMEQLQYLGYGKPTEAQIQKELNENPEMQQLVNQKLQQFKQEAYMEVMKKKQATIVQIK